MPFVMLRYLWVCVCVCVVVVAVEMSEGASLSPNLLAESLKNFFLFFFLATTFPKTIFIRHAQWWMNWRSIDFSSAVVFLVEHQPYLNSTAIFTKNERRDEKKRRNFRWDIPVCRQSILCCYISSAYFLALALHHHHHHLFLIISLVDQWMCARHISGKRQTKYKTQTNQKYQTMNMNRWCCICGTGGLLFFFFYFFSSYGFRFHHHQYFPHMAGGEDSFTFFSFFFLFGWLVIGHRRLCRNRIPKCVCVFVCFFFLVCLCVCVSFLFLCLVTDRIEFRLCVRFFPIWFSVDCQRTQRSGLAPQQKEKKEKNSRSTIHSWARQCGDDRNW